MIGTSVSIKGEVTGQENLRIQGRIEGKTVIPYHLAVLEEFWNDDFTTPCP